MSEVLYQCPRCGHVCLDKGDAPVCTECFLSNVTREPALMVQVWPAPWISVEERLPAKGEYVLAWAMHSWWTLALEPYYPDGSCAWHDSEWMDFKYVTHWQPGPSAPETESDG